MSISSSLQSAMRSLDSPLMDAMLPFLLIFTVIFAVLEKSTLLGEGKRNMNTVIAIVISLIVVVPHITNSYPGRFDPVDVINSALPQVSILIVAIVMVLILIGLFGQDKIFLGLSMPGWVAAFSIVAIIFIFADAAGYGGTGVTSWLNSTFGQEITTVVVMILVFGIIIAFITGGEGKRENISALNRIGIDFKKLFGGGGHH
ncbi:hypothetical protein ACFLZX_03570 [Nanoarchaeota archaeon]